VGAGVSYASGVHVGLPRGKATASDANSRPTIESYHTKPGTSSRILLQTKSANIVGLAAAFTCKRPVLRGRIMSALIAANLAGMLGDIWILFF
jgi:hypothetical protein